MDQNLLSCFKKHGRKPGMAHYFLRVRMLNDSSMNEWPNRTLRQGFIKLGYLTPVSLVSNRRVTERLVEYDSNPSHQALGYLPSDGAPNQLSRGAGYVPIGYIPFRSSTPKEQKIERTVHRSILPGNRQNQKRSDKTAFA